MKMKKVLQVIGLSLSVIGFLWILCFPSVIEKTSTVSEDGYTSSFYYRYLDFWNDRAFIMEVIGFVTALIGSLFGEREIILQQPKR